MRKATRVDMPESQSRRIISMFCCVGFTLFYLAACGSRSTQSKGEQLYTNLCQACHQKSGVGVRGLYAPLAGTPVAIGDGAVMLEWVMYGIRPASLPRGQYSGAMPQFNFLSDQDAAALLTYVRSSFGNSAPPVSVATVVRVRAAHLESGN